MTSITETTIYEESNQEDHIRSPFQLGKNKEKPVKLVSLPQNLGPVLPNNAEVERSSVSSIDSSEPASPSSKSSIGSSPFSLNIKKVSKSIPSPVSNSLPTTSLLTSAPLTGATSTLLTNSSLNNKSNLKDSERIVELQNNIVNLEKEIEAKDAKLSSTLKSIKQFWSPELKKERAARKEETEKCLILKDKYQIASSQIEEYKNALEDLESEFQSQQKTIQDLNEKLKSNQEQAKHESENEIEQLKLKVKTQDDEIFILNKTLEELENKYNGIEEELEEKNKCISDLEIILVDHEKKITDYDVDRKEIEKLNDAIHEQEIDYQMLKKENDELKSVNEGLKENKVDPEEVNALNERIEALSNKLEKQEKMYDLCKEDFERSRKSDIENQSRVEELEKELQDKEKECDQVQQEMQTVQNQLEEIQREYEKLEEQLKDGNAASDLVEQKDKEIRNLNTKYEKLDTYLSERENALELCRDELKGVKTKNRDLRLEVDNLENQLFEQKSAVERLEKQKDRYTRPKEDVALVAAHNELKTKYEDAVVAHNEFQTKYEDAQKELQTLQKQTSDFENTIEEKNEKMNSLEEQLTQQRTAIENNEKELEQLKQDKIELTTEIEKLRNEKKPVTDELQTTAGINKPSKAMWGEMAKKDERIEELERQLKEKTKQVASFKKNQTTEREKQHHLVNESKKVEIEIQQLEEEKDKRGQRVAMLEDALRESVNIALEREELLAGHKDMYENARNECEREKLEKKITNIKNAFLILSLSEKDALIVSMEATRKRQMEELFNIKQQRLLDSISEKDNQIAHLELQSSKTKKQDIKQLKMEKEKFVGELKTQNNNRMTVLNNGEKTCKNLLMTELEDAPAEQVYEAIRHLSTSTGKLEYYIEELFSNEQYKKDLVDLPAMPKKKSKSVESLKKLSKQELMKELKVVDADSNQLREFVLRLLDKLEGVA